MAISIIGNLLPPKGKSTKKIVAGTASVADGGTIDTGLSSIDFAVVMPSVADRVVAITSISGGTITVSIHDNTGAAVTTAETVYVFAIGDPA